MGGQPNTPPDTAKIKPSQARDPRNLFFGDFPTEAARADRRGIADRFRRGHKEHERHRDNRTELKLRRVGKELGKGNDAQLLHGCLHRRKSDHAEKQRDNIARNQTEQHVKLLPEVLRQRVIHKARRKRNHRNQKVLPRAGGIDRRACKRRDAGRKQTEADGRHDTCRDNRADKTPPVFCAQAEQALNAAADNDGSDHQTIILRGKRHHGRKERKAQAHHDRQPRTDTPDGVELNERADTGNQHCRLNEQRRVDGGECRAVVNSDARNQHDRRDIATNIASTCCSPNGIAFAIGTLPSSF